MMNDRDVGLSEFESLVISHWFVRTARIIKHSSAGPKLNNALGLRVCAVDLGVAAHHLSAILLQKSFDDPDSAFIALSDVARQSAVKAEAVARRGGSAERMIAIGTAARALAIAISVGDYDAELKALVREVGVPRKGQALRDLGLAREALAPWSPGQSRREPARTRAEATSEYPATGGRKGVRVARKTATRKSTGRKKVARKTPRRKTGGRKKVAAKKSVRKTGARKSVRRKAGARRKKSAAS